MAQDMANSDASSATVKVRRDLATYESSSSAKIVDPQREIQCSSKWRRTQRPIHVQHREALKNLHWVSRNR